VKKIVNSQQKSCAESNSSGPNHDFLKKLNLKIFQELHFSHGVRVAETSEKLKNLKNEFIEKRRNGLKYDPDQVTISWVAGVGVSLYS
jgi:uncharacterized protein YggL (DUF469 family)